MAVTHVKGVHEIRRGRAASAGAGKSEQGKLTSRLSRLDHQRALLQNQLTVWTQKQQVTRHRLKLLDGEIAAVTRELRSLLKIKSGRAAVRRPSMTADATPAQPDSSAARGSGDAINLEY